MKKLYKYIISNEEMSIFFLIVFQWLTLLVVFLTKDAESHFSLISMAILMSAIGSSVSILFAIPVIFIYTKVLMVEDNVINKSNKIGFMVGLLGSFLYTFIPIITIFLKSAILPLPMLAIHFLLQGILVGSISQEQYFNHLKKKNYLKGERRIYNYILSNKKITTLYFFIFQWFLLLLQVVLMPEFNLEKAFLIIAPILGYLTLFLIPFGFLFKKIFSINNELFQKILKIDYLISLISGILFTILFMLMFVFTKEIFVVQLFSQGMLVRCIFQEEIFTYLKKKESLALAIRKPCESDSSSANSEK